MRLHGLATFCRDSESLVCYIETSPSTSSISTSVLSEPRTPDLEFYSIALLTAAVLNQILYLGIRM